MRKKSATILLIALVAGLGLVACGDDDDDGGGGDGGLGGGGGSEESFCDDARSLEERFAEFEDSTEFDTGLFEDFRDAVNDLNPPEEIQDDWDTFLEGLDRFIEEFGDADLSDPAVLERLGELEEEFAEFSEASDRITTFLEEECGISTE